MPFDGEASRGFDDLDSEAAAIPCQTQCQMILGVEQPRIAGLGREEHQLTKRDDPSDLKPFARLAAGMTDDLEAITNAFRYPWSTGPVEGHITRVKLIKRAGYGRAKLPLLRARILGPN